MLSKEDTKLEIFGFGDDDSEDNFYCLVNLTKSPDGIDLKKVKKAGLNVNHLPETFDNLKKQKVLHLSLQLEITDRASKKEICLYDEDDEYSLEPEFKLNIARKWDAMLQKSMLA